MAQMEVNKAEVASRVLAPKRVCGRVAALRLWFLGLGVWLGAGDIAFGQFHGR